MRTEMREILFRGKSIDHNGWEEGDLITSFGKTYIGNTVGNHIIHWCRIHPETVGQFIGRFTESEKKIFEGDIIFVDDLGVGGYPHEMKSGTYKVVWNNIEAMFMLELLDGSDGVTFDECSVYSIIGNVHDNPELLQ